MKHDLLKPFDPMDYSVRLLVLDVCIDVRIFVHASNYVCIFSWMDIFLRNYMCLFVYFLLIYLTQCQCFLHIETNQLICTANQLTGFYMRKTVAINGLN